MDTVVVLHGLWLKGTELGLLRRRLRTAGFDPRQFRYRSMAAGLDQNAAQLAAHLETLPGQTVHLLGHSLGGVVILRMLQRYAVERNAVERIGRVVCLGSPLQGSGAARVLAKMPGGTRVLGKTMAELSDGGVVDRWSGAPELGIIAGDFPMGLGQLLGGVPVPHDGTVAVQETRLEGATDHLVLPVSHFSMLWSREVVEQVVGFLRDGRFLR